MSAEQSLISAAEFREAGTYTLITFVVGGKILRAERLLVESEGCRDGVSGVLGVCRDPIEVEALLLYGWYSREGGSALGGLLSRESSNRQ
jgi:hypothetical protein